MSDTKHALKIERMQDGGFVVSDTVPFGGHEGSYCEPRYAATSIDDALTYIKRMMVPQMIATNPEELLKCRPGQVNMVKLP